ncbi:ribosome maturation factor RimP [Myxococcus xanthus]|nr:Ribosome maturation factor RimP [Myxococcus xanthus]
MKHFEKWAACPLFVFLETGFPLMSEKNLKQTVEERALALLEPIVAGEGLELVDLEFLREREGWVLRLFIDKPGGRVGLDECTQVSRAVDPSLDVEDFIPHEYNLEVSSPGVDRPLRKPTHFERVKGQQVKVKTFGPVGEPPRKNFTGTLTEVAGDGISVEVEGAGTFHILFKDIAKANLEFQF